MGLTTTQSCEVDAATGADTNGGWFDPASAGHDLTYGAFQAVIAFTDIQMDGSSNVTFTSAGNPVQTTWVGNWMRIPAGVTGFTAGLYKISSVTAGSPNKAVLNTSPASTSTLQTNGTIKLGGSLLTVDQALTDGNSHQPNIWIKYNASVYLINSGYNLSGGGLSIGGYTTTRNDRSTRPTIRHSTTSITTFTSTTFQGNSLFNVILDGNNQAGSRGFSCGISLCKIYDVKFMNFVNEAIAGNNGGQPFGATVLINCEFTGCSSSVTTVDGNYGMYFYACTMHGNTNNGARGNGALFNNCAFYGNNIGYASNGNGGLILNCVAYNNTQYGFGGTGVYDPLVVINCVSTSNGTYGYTGIASTPHDAILFYNCAGFGNSTALFNDPTNTNSINGTITLTADPFSSASTGDFSLNANAGGGTSLKNAGFPATFAGTITTTYQDVGIAQHNAAGGGAASIGYA